MMQCPGPGGTWTSISAEGISTAGLMSWVSSCFASPISSLPRLGHLQQDTGALWPRTLAARGGFCLWAEELTSLGQAAIHLDPKTDGRERDKLFNWSCPAFCSQPSEGELRRIGVALLFFYINATDVWALLAGSSFGFLLYLHILSSRKTAEITN